MRILVFAVVCVALFGAPGAARVAAQAPTEVRVSELKGSPFHAEGLTLTVRKLDDYVYTSADVRDTGGGFVILKIENPSARFLAFTPNRLAIVGRDGKQASPRSERHNVERVPPSEVRVAPGARVEVQYNLTERVRYPAKLYYGDTLLADLVE
jgi:hypothetical protein